MIEPTQELDAALRIILDRRGIDFSGYKRGVMRRRLEDRAARRGCRTVREYLSCLEREPSAIDELVHAFRPKVTQFFRDPDMWVTLRDRVLPDLIARRKRKRALTVWSAGCSTGEEAYSLAMAIASILGGSWASWHITILATNLDAAALRNAHIGIYSQRRLVGIDPALLARWTVPSGGDARRIHPRLRRWVRFSVHNLSEPPPVHDVDVILCRNVIMYLDGPTQRRVLGHLREALAPDGVIALGRGESVIYGLGDFDAVDRRNRIYRADRHAPAA